MPGMILPESLTPAVLFRADSAKSPANPPINNIIPINMAMSSVKRNEEGIIADRRTATAMLKRRPPIVPSHDFFGLIDGMIL